MRDKIINITRTGFLCAFLCTLSPFSIPMGTVPISLATFAVMFAGLFGNNLQGIWSVLIYLFIGTIGVPVFSGANGGFGVLLGPTGGFLIGYIPLVVCVVLFKKIPGTIILGIIAGNLMCYFFGIAWYMVSMKVNFFPAIVCCVLPFIPGDTLKIALSVFIYKRSATVFRSL